MMNAPFHLLRGLSIATALAGGALWIHCWTINQQSQEISDNLLQWRQRPVGCRAIQFNLNFPAARIDKFPYTCKARGDMPWTNIVLILRDFLNIILILKRRGS